MLRFRVTFSIQLWVRATVILLVLSVLRGAAEETLEAGEVHLVPPAGWTAKRDPKGPLVLTRTDGGDLSAIIVYSEPLNGPLPDGVRGAMHRGFTDTKLSLERLKDGPSVFGLPAVSFQESFRHPELRRRLQVYGLALNVRGRLQLAWLATVSNKSASEREREFEQMVRAWRFKEPAPERWDPMKARKAPKELAGFYWGSKITNRYNGLSGGMQMKAVRHYLVLLPSGQAYRGLPPGGRVLDMDFAERLREDPEQCGMYSVDGDEIVLEWADALGMRRTERIPLKGRGKNFQFRGVQVSRLPPVSNLRVNGRYTASNVTMSNLGGSNTTVSSARTLVLTPDGRYTKSGFVGLSFSHDSGGGGAGSSKSAPSSGSYMIDGYRMTLTPDEGPAEHFTVLIETPGPSPGALFIDGSAYLKSASG